MSDLISNLEKQGLKEDRVAEARASDPGQPFGMASVGDGVIAALQSLATDKPEPSSDDRTNLPPDRQVMNYQVARHQFERSRLFGMKSEQERQDSLVKAANAYDLGRSLCESPIEEYILPWLIFQDWRPFSEPPTLVFAPDADDPPPVDAGVFVVPQLKFGRYRLDFAVIARRRDRSVIIGLECDGVEFHEAYRDQRRDAYFAAFRIPIVRATGREIKEFPDRVVARVVNIIEAWSRRP